MFYTQARKMNKCYFMYIWWILLIFDFTRGAELEYVHVIWRHGDRTPGELLHPEQDLAKWPQGVGELTKLGVEQQYRLGQWLRRRYGDWIGEVNSEKIYIRSSDYNRTLMSAQANLAGFFPPKTGLEHDLQWQPIPIHSMPKEIDKELYESIQCPIAQKELENQWNSKEASRLREEYRETLEFFQKSLKFEKPIEFSDIWRIFDNFWCEKCNRIAWPEWLNSTMFEKLEQIYHRVSMMEYKTDTLRRLRGGTLLSEILNRLTAKSLGHLGINAKFYAYSAHDSTIAALLSTFGIFNPIFPKYATCLMIEMHKSIDNNKNTTIRYLKLWHKNETDIDRIVEYQIPNCEAPCTLEKAKQDLDKFLPRDWKYECGIVENDVTAYIITIFLLLFATCFLATILILDKLKLKFRRKTFQRLKTSPDGIPMLENDSDEEI